MIKSRGLLNEFCFFMLLCCIGCNTNNVNEKFQNDRDNVLHVKNRIKEFHVENVLIGSYARSYVLNDYILIADYKSLDKMVHVFDAKTLQYMTSCVNRGEGPEEVLNMGCLGIDEAHRTFYVSDHAKLKIFSYPIDSVLANPFYVHQIKTEMNAAQFPSEYQYINDTLCIGRVICPIGNNDYKPTVAKWNMTTGMIIPMEYNHPDIKKKRMLCTASVENGIYVECYQNRDLMTICTLDGNLKFNVYGPDWKHEAERDQYYDQPVICKNYILVPCYDNSEYKKPSSPTKILIFDINGDYLQTLEVGYNIQSFCYDRCNNRLILVLNDEIQFGYLDMNGII